MRDGKRVRGNDVWIETDVKNEKREREIKERENILYSGVFITPHLNYVCLHP